MVKGAALFLQQGSSAQEPRTPTHHKNAGKPQHGHNHDQFHVCEEFEKLNN